jgi:phosphatidylglycerophosphatase A
MTEDSQTAGTSGGFLARFLATFFLVGYLPKAPGTWASGATAIILYFIWPGQWYFQVVLIAAVYLIGVWVSGRAEKSLGHDARRIVIDEVAGQMLALFMAPPKIVAYVLAFLLFRLFDIIKPPPARQWEQLRGGWGVMADDMAAGTYAAIILNFLLALLDRWGISYF